MTRNNIKPEIVILSLGHNDREGTAIDTPMLGEIRRACFRLRVCTTIQQVFSTLSIGKPSIVVIDVMGHPHIDSLVLTSSIQSNFHAGIVLFVGPTSDDRAQGFRSGADVCLSYPVQSSVVVAFLHTLSKRMDEATPELLVARRDEQKPWMLDPDNSCLQAPNETKFLLNRAELKFLTYLFNDESHAFQRQEWLKMHTFTRRSEGSSNRNIDAMVCRLRKRIAEKSLYFPLITAYGTGYQFTGTCTFCSA